MFNAGYYRNRGAYLVGRLNNAKDKSRPFIIALLNAEDGIYFDTLITRTNLDRFDGEEDIPEWFFESGVILLPEEIVAGLYLPYGI